MLEGVTNFVQEISVPIQVQTNGGYLSVKESSTERQESSIEVLYVNGRISCSTARAIASHLEITLSQTGQLLDHLKVKIRQCELGCF